MSSGPHTNRLKSFLGLLGSCEYLIGVASLRFVSPPQIDAGRSDGKERAAQGEGKVVAMGEVIDQTGQKRTDQGADRPSQIGESQHGADGPEPEEGVPLPDGPV